MLVIWLEDCWIFVIAVLLLTLQSSPLLVIPFRVQVATHNLLLVMLCESPDLSCLNYERVSACYLWSRLETRLTLALAKPIYHHQSVSWLALNAWRYSAIFVLQYRNTLQER